MSQNEQIEICTVPSQWQTYQMILPSTIGTCKTMYPYCFSRRDLASYLLLYTLQGEGQLEYGGSQYTLHRGDLFFIDCRQPQTYRALSPQWDFAFIHTEADAQISAYYSAITQGGKSPVFRYTPFMQDCWDKVYGAVAENRPESPVRASLYLVSLLLDLLALRQKSVPEDLEAAAAYIKAHYNERICLDALAALAHMSKFHFVRRFGQFYGVTPHEYLQNCRVDCAKAQLLSTDASIEDIALYCGYTTASAFCQSFKKHNGVSPAVFRKQMKMI